MTTLAVQKCKQLRRRYYPEAEWPGNMYQHAVAKCRASDHVLLEIGCGREGKRLRRMGVNFGLAIGVDMEVAPDANRDAGVGLILGDAHRLALRSESVDVVASANVAEHLADPVAVFAECRRVLKPGGRLIVMTVNQWFPPIVLGRLLPHRLRQLANKIASGTADEDTFPAYYRANTVKNLTEAAVGGGLRPIEVRTIPHHPDYLTFSTAAYRIGVMMERIIRPCDGLRHMILGVFERPPSFGGDGPC